ncbi:hypothetical protein LTR62_002065 [Meristemomyces frigidus]|uniref:F-box domain-containing protein n=1 Tax=Meristemomyces frigidus TaxID=1508187 RepID=A0AAN7TGB4_9PEZI|nr:hypothetical protein LTR62_002065 [Meristemomyces frigidus]
MPSRKRIESEAEEVIVVATPPSPTLSAASSVTLVATDYAPNPFDSVPIEIRQRIATYLDSDFDLCNYNATCKATNEAVDQDNYSFWRQRFTSTFERPSWSGRRSNFEFKKQYQRRQSALRYGANYAIAVRGSSKNPRLVSREMRKAVLGLEVLKELLLDAYSEMDGDDDKTACHSSNMEHIAGFLHNHDLLDEVLTADYTKERKREVIAVPQDLLQTVQVLLAPAMFDLECPRGTFGFPESQHVVYASACDIPIFVGCNNLDVNTEWVLHHLNFWKYHMTRSEEETLHPAFEDLAEDERPRFPSKQLAHGGGEDLGKHWKGSYAYVDRAEISRIRNSISRSVIITDEFNGDDEHGQGSFQDLELSLLGGDTDIWPPLFEQTLHSLRVPSSHAKTRAQRRCATADNMPVFMPQNFQFSGEGEDVTEEFHALGWLNALPPQNGVPGWQRMTMMKYFQDPVTRVMDTAALWAYEGVVLPGGQIMLGRWWCVSDGTGRDQYSGPFILWNVDGPRKAERRVVDEDNLP